MKNGRSEQVIVVTKIKYNTNSKLKSKICLRKAVFVLFLFIISRTAIEVVNQCMRIFGCFVLLSLYELKNPNNFSFVFHGRDIADTDNLVEIRVTFIITTVWLQAVGMCWDPLMKFIWYLCSNEYIWGRTDSNYLKLHIVHKNNAINYLFSISYGWEIKNEKISNVHHIVNRLHWYKKKYIKEIIHKTHVTHTHYIIIENHITKCLKRS